jgi:arylsulfatase A-like enzyme
MRWAISSLFAFLPATLLAADRPNVLLVITDDQGFGDMGAHGNPVVRTPHLDAFTRESVRLKNFHVSPVCSPTRASLLTGLYNYRTGLVDTFIGRSMMRPDVKTLAEYLAAAGYRTGLFGKWHLGDNYPMRPEDRGFQETLWHHGGGLAQPSDAPEVDPKTAYFDPILTRNGKGVKMKGYCTDVFTEAALKFITAETKKPFFAYVAFNCPHSPYQVPPELAKPYAKLDLTPAGFPQTGQPWATKKLNADEIARAYGMIENIDANFGRLMKALEDNRLAENTLVIFLTDNGPGGVRWNAGLRNRKGTVYEGGIRVPCYVRWPKEAKVGEVVGVPLAHIDVLPTVLDVCRVPFQSVDGKSFRALLRRANTAWANRALFFQWHRGDEPEKFRAFAVNRAGLKLVQANGVQPGAKWAPKYELFDLVADPFEEKDLAADKPEEVAALKALYEQWFADVTKRGFAPPRIVIGSEKANPVRLSRQDWRGPKAGWAPESEGHWEVEVAEGGIYELTVLSRTAFTEAEFEARGTLPDGSETAREAKHGSGEAMKERPFRVAFVKGAKLKLSARVAANGQRRGTDYLVVKFLGAAEKK